MLTSNTMYMFTYIHTHVGSHQLVESVGIESGDMGSVELKLCALPDERWGWVRCTPMPCKPGQQVSRTWSAAMSEFLQTSDLCSKLEHPSLGFCDVPAFQVATS